MSVVVSVKGDMIQQLSKFVKQAAESQIDTIMELSNELSKHNRLVERALERQERMIQKVERIENRLMSKEFRQKMNMSKRNNNMYNNHGGGREMEKMFIQEMKGGGQLRGNQHSG